MVERPATDVVQTFPAAAFMPEAAVAATAVHGHRIRIPSSRPAPQSISIQPREFGSMPRGYGGHVPGPSAILTDISAGESVFRELAPLAGDSVYLESSGKRIEIPRDWKPRAGDVLLIAVTTSQEGPSEIVFQNRAGGSVLAHYAAGGRTIGRVERPVTGVGRFDGTSYTGIGAINTNHGGVISISTAPATRPLDEGKPPERRGGFQIQPSSHASTQRPMPQAMVVAPSAEETPLEGAPPLFSGHIALGDGSSVVDVRYGDSDWQPLPAVVGKIDDAFTAAGVRRLTAGRYGEPVTEIRLRFPGLSRDRLAAAIAAAERKVPSARPLEWRLDLQRSVPAAYVIFSTGDRTLSITNVAPFAISVPSPTSGQVLRAEVVDSGGKTVQVIQVRLRLEGGKWNLEPLP